MGLTKAVRKQLHELLLGEYTTVGRRIYGRCSDCGKVVWINKPFFGGWHSCVSLEEAEQMQRENPGVGNVETPR
jgi:hypothetical protein